MINFLTKKTNLTECYTEILQTGKSYDNVMKEKKDATRGRSEK